MVCDQPGCECSARCLRAYCPPTHLKGYDRLLSDPPRRGRLRLADISVTAARQASRLGVLDDVLTVARLNERCDCGEVPNSLECRDAHSREEPTVAVAAPRQPWEPRPARRNAIAA